MYGTAPDTVFRWIRDEGLPRIEAGRKYLVHGSSFYVFIENKIKKRKKPCKTGEIFCCKCKCPRTPNPETLKPKKQANKTYRVFARCSVCNTKMNTVVSGKKWSENHPFYPKPQTPISPPNGESKSQRKCQIKEEDQLCLNLTL